MNKANRKVLLLNNRKEILKLVIDTDIYAQNFGVSYVLWIEHKKEVFLDNKKKRDERILQGVQERLKSSEKWVESQSYSDGS